MSRHRASRREQEPGMLRFRVMSRLGLAEPSRAARPCGREVEPCGVAPARRDHRTLRLRPPPRPSPPLPLPTRAPYRMRPWLPTPPPRVNSRAVAHASRRLIRRQAVRPSGASEARRAARPRTRTPSSARTWDEVRGLASGAHRGRARRDEGPHAFVYGDFRRLHRMGLIACHYRAAGGGSEVIRRSSSPPTSSWQPHLDAARA